MGGGGDPTVGSRWAPEYKREGMHRLRQGWNGPRGRTVTDAYLYDLTANDSVTSQV